MKKSFKVYLKAGERLFVNGAVLRVDRKVSIEFLNDVAFLLEGNVLQPEEATTPLRQLYFVVQALLIDKERTAEARGMYEALHENFTSTFDNAEILAGLCTAHAFAEKGKLYDALRTIRSLFPLEAELERTETMNTESIGELAECP